MQQKRGRQRDVRQHKTESATEAALSALLLVANLIVWSYLLHNLCQAVAANP